MSWRVIIGIVTLVATLAGGYGIKRMIADNQRLSAQNDRLNSLINDMSAERELLEEMSADREQRAHKWRREHDEAARRLREALNDDEDLAKWYRRPANRARAEFLRVRPDSDRAAEAPARADDDADNPD